MLMNTVIIIIIMVIATTMISTVFRIARRLHGTLGVLPLPACGERVGVRGTHDTLSAWRAPLTRSLRSRPLPARGERCRLQRFPSYPRESLR
jgi:hypothetical protein